MKFNPGDKVRCILGARGSLTKGKVYTVSVVDELPSYLIGLAEKGDCDPNWFAYRFEPVDGGCKEHIR